MTSFVRRRDRGGAAAALAYEAHELGGHDDDADNDEDDAERCDEWRASLGLQAAIR